MERLGASGHSVLVYGNWTTSEIRERLETPSMRLLKKPVDLRATATECDLAILNGTHGATAAMLLGGAAILQLPIYLEQYLVAERVIRMGAGLVAERENVEQIIERMNRILGDARFADGARRFADTYRHVSPERQFEKMMDQLRGLLPDDAIVPG